MYTLNTIKFYVKSRKTPFSRFLYDMAMKLRYFRLPAPKIIFTPLLYLHLFIKKTVGLLVTFFYWKPLFLQYVDNKPKYLALYHGMPFIVGNPKIIIGEFCTIDGLRTSVIARPSSSIRPQLTIGNKVYINNHVGFFVGSEIIIGDGCLIASGCTFRGYSGHPVDPKMRRLGLQEDEESLGAIVLGKNVWIAQDVKIMPGVTIGDNAVIASGSLVNKDIPANVLAGGVPAKVIRQLEIEYNDPIV